MQEINLLFKDRIMRQFTLSKEMSFSKKLQINVVSGGLSGVLTDCFLYSFDFARTQMAVDCAGNIYLLPTLDHLSKEILNVISVQTKTGNGSTKPSTTSIPKFTNLMASEDCTVDLASLASASLSIEVTNHVMTRHKNRYIFRFIFWTV